MSRCKTAPQKPFCWYTELFVFIILSISNKRASNLAVSSRFIDPGEVSLTAHCEKPSNPLEQSFGNCLKSCSEIKECAAIKYNHTGCYSYKYLTAEDNVLTEALYVKDNIEVIKIGTCGNQDAVNKLGDHDLLKQIVLVCLENFTFVIQN